MIRRSKKHRQILLPWERQNAWLGELLSGRRWRTVVLAVVGLGFVAFAFQAADRRARTRATRAAIAEARRAVAGFIAEMGRCPHSAVELLHPPKAGAHYLDELPVDGWGRPLYIRCPGEDPKDIAEIIARGPSGSFLADDTIR